MTVYYEEIISVYEEFSYIPFVSKGIEFTQYMGKITIKQPPKLRKGEIALHVHLLDSNNEIDECN